MLQLETSMVVMNWGVEMVGGYKDTKEILGSRYVRFTLKFAKRTSDMPKRL